MDNITNEIMKWATVHPVLATILGVATIAGTTVTGVAFTRTLGNVAGEIIDKGTGISFGNGKYSISLNQSLPAMAPVQKMPQVVQAAPQQAAN